MIVSALSIQSSQFSLSGVCPHCSRDSVFVIASSPGSDPIPRNIHPHGRGLRIFAAMQCQGCRDYILGVVFRPDNATTFLYLAHYPLGKPKDDVAAEIPAAIAMDFSEALRCRWVDAYNATAEMCRRALEASCIDLGAPKKQRSLDDKLDWLASEGKITSFLQQVAHKIRLGGNRAAHPPEKAAAEAAPAESDVEAPPLVITSEHADAIIKFTKEFFHHVYVVPRELEKYDFSKPGASGSAT
jgi:hypothetical protein